MSSALFQKLNRQVGAVTTALILSLPMLASAQVANVRTVCDLLRPLSNVARLVSYIVGVLAILIMLYAGFLFLVAAGNEETLKKAKLYLLYGLIGIAVGLLAFNADEIVSNIVGGGAFEAVCPELR